MCLICINAGQSSRDDLWAAAAALPQGAPVVVMIHGYRYAPGDPAYDPHNHILSLTPSADLPHTVSWPRALGFGGGMPGLGIAFGWHARGGLRRAYARAAEVGQELAGLIGGLAQCTGRPVALIAHSLGARVALTAISNAAPGTVGRVILMSAAEFNTPAEHALASPAGALAEVINVTSRENDPYDFGIEWILAAGRQRALGAGLDRPRRNWLDIQIDDSGTLTALAALGFPVSDRVRRFCHWSSYLREGMFSFYRALLSRPSQLPLAMLQAHLPCPESRRWSRLLALPRFGQRMAEPNENLHGSSA